LAGHIAGWNKFIHKPVSDGMFFGEAVRITNLEPLTVSHTENQAKIHRGSGQNFQEMVFCLIKQRWLKVDDRAGVAYIRLEEALTEEGIHRDAENETGV